MVIKSTDHTRAAEAYEYVWRTWRHCQRRARSTFVVDVDWTQIVWHWLSEQHARHTLLAEREARKRAKEGA